MINKEQQTFKALFTDNGANFRANLSGGTGNSAEAYLRGLLEGYAQGIVNSLLDKGEGEDSIQQEGAKAIGPRTIALGTSIAGCKGYYYSGIDFTNKYIYLSLTQRVPDKIVDYLFGLGEHDVINSKVNVISSPSNLTADANKYCIITTPGAQVSFTNLTLNGYSKSLEYKLRVKNIGRVDFYTPQSAGETLISITGLPTTYARGKVYDIRITGGTAEYAIVDIDGAYYDASFTPEWQVGDAFSIVNSSHYDEIGKITSIDGNRIGYDTIGFDEINLNDSALEDFDSYTIVVTTRPECGVINLGEGAFSASDNGKATGRYSVNLARNGRTIGDYAFNVGRDNIVGYASGAIGGFLKHLGKWGFSGGWSNETPADYAVTLGGGLINPYECGTILGWCNDPTIPDLLFGLGYGFNGVRKNAFNIDIYGNVWVDKDPTMPKGLATKQYVDKYARERKVITNPNAYLDPNVYYVLDMLRPHVNITLNEPTNKDIVNEYKFRIYGLENETMQFWNGEDGSLITNIIGLPGTYTNGTLTFEGGAYYEISIIDGFAKYTVLGETEWQNPPLKIGIEYRTAERWNGNPVYTKLIDMGALPSAGTTKNKSISDCNATQIIRVSGQILNSGTYGGDPLPYYDQEYGDIRVCASRNNAKISTVSWTGNSVPITSLTATVQIWYVK